MGESFAFDIGEDVYVVGWLTGLESDFLFGLFTVYGQLESPFSGLMFFLISLVQTLSVLCLEGRDLFRDLDRYYWLVRVCMVFQCQIADSKRGQFAVKVVLVVIELSFVFVCVNELLDPAFNVVKGPLIISVYPPVVRTYLFLFIRQLLLSLFQRVNQAVVAALFL